jgi:serine protease Do
MKKYLSFSWLVVLCFSTYSGWAQPDKKPKSGTNKDTEQIIIKSKDGKDTKLTIELKDGEVWVNGKPLAEFKDDKVTIRKGSDLLFELRTDPLTMTFPRSHSRGGNSYFNEVYPRLNGKLEELRTLNGEFGDDNAFLGVVTEKHDDGARITEVMEKTAAEKAGLKEGDIITKINDKIVDDPNDLSKVLNTYKPEEKVTISYKRNGKDEKVSLALGKRKSIRAFGNISGFSERPGYSFSFSDWNRSHKLGIKAQETDEGKGVKVLEVDEDCPAAKAGLKEGDIITELDGEAINDIDELVETAMKGIKKGSFGVKYTRDGKALDTTIKIPKKLKTADL